MKGKPLNEKGDKAFRANDRSHQPLGRISVITIAIFDAAVKRKLLAMSLLDKNLGPR